MSVDGTVFVVDDNEGIRDALCRLMEVVELPVQAFASAEAFLSSYDPTQSGCLILDIRMPGMSGIELQERLLEERIRIPVIIISAHGDIDSAVRTIRSGAVDFIRKPYDATDLLQTIRVALETDKKQRAEEIRRAEVAEQISLLTKRELEVMGLLVDGKSSRQIAEELGLSSKTVEGHRLHVMLKLRADSVVDLVIMAQIHGMRD